MSNEYEKMRTADIVAEALLDWKVNTIFGLPGDGINGFIESLRRRQDKINSYLLDMRSQQHLWLVHMQSILENLVHVLQLRALELYIF
jgi:hypothetical protein